MAPAPNPHHPAAPVIDPVFPVTMLPAAELTGDDGAGATLKQNAAGVLGNAASLSLAGTFAITPVTGWAMAPDPGAPSAPDLPLSRVS